LSNYLPAVLALYKNDRKKTGGGEFQIQFHATNNVFMNNIVYSTSQGLLVHSFTNSTPDDWAAVDYNLYYSAGAAKNAAFMWVGKTYHGFSEYVAATGNDSHSCYADPLLLNAVTPDLHVQPNSPAVNTGINLGPDMVGTLDFAGNPRVQGSDIDKGAYEQ
jgi:hypothetical protein